MRAHQPQHAVEFLNQALASLRGPLPGLPLMIQAHGDSDPHVPYAQVVRLKEALDHAGDPNQLITLHGSIHGWAPDGN